jgi:hypothetical protein
MYGDENLEPNGFDLSVFEPDLPTAGLTAEQARETIENMTGYLVSMFVEPHDHKGLAEVAARTGELYSKAAVWKLSPPADMSPFTHTDVDPYAIATLEALAQISDQELALSVANRLRDLRRITLVAPRGAVSPLDGVGPPHQSSAERVDIPA